MATMNVLVWNGRPRAGKYMIQVKRINVLVICTKQAVSSMRPELVG